jgi:hypothetical protein
LGTTANAPALELVALHPHIEKGFAADYSAFFYRLQLFAESLTQRLFSTECTHAAGAGDSEISTHPSDRNMLSRSNTRQGYGD